MSFGHSTPGKDIWGTTTYKIHLIPTSNTFDESFSGTLILYERRWEKNKATFDNLTSFITLLKEFWGESLQRGIIQETRLARWVEEYLNQINIDVKYESALQAVKGQAVAVRALDGVGERANKEIITDFLRKDTKLESEISKKFIKTPEGVLPSIFEIQLDESIDMEDNADEFLSALLEKHKPERASQISSSSTFVDEAGVTRTIEKKIQIEDSPTTGNSKMGGGLENTFQFTLTDVEIEDAIPFEFTVEDIEVSSQSVEKIGEEIKDGGLYIKWKIPKLEPKEKINIDYYLGSRLTRTIVAYHGDKVNLINTYEPIIKQKDGLYADALFVNETENVLNKIKIVDQIPKELDLVSSTPIIEDSNHQFESDKTQEIHWEYSQISPKSEILVHYDLKERPYILRDIYEVGTAEGEPVLQVSKVVKQLKLQYGFGVIFAIRTIKQIDEEVNIQDVVPKDFEVTSITTEEGNVLIGEKDGKKVIDWIIRPTVKGQIYHAFLRYKPKDKFDNTKLKIQLGEKSSKATGDITSTRSEQSVVLPYQYTKYVDVRS